MKSILFFLSLCLTINLTAQNITVKGKILDNKHKALPGATVYFFTADNPTQKKGNIADNDGNFTVGGLSEKSYTMQVSFVGFNNYTKTVTINQNNQDLGTIILKEQTFALKEVTAVGRESRAVQANDTMRYNADAFKTVQGANVEALISKMPGIVVDNSGTVQAQGETVKKVLIDGKPFFDGDPTLALRNLPAEIVQNIEVFDKKSDQAEFTGFDDGNSVKTINVITRRGMQTGVFGKLVGGIGMDKDKDVDYQSSASVNLFQGDRRITLLGMSNNVNQQNFSQEDLAGVMSGGGSRGGRGGGSRGGVGNFVIGGQSGMTKTNAGGFNYTDKWGSKIDVTGGYFFNMTTNALNQSSSGQYFAPDSLGRIRTFDGTSIANTTNYNHRFNLKLDYKVDDNNSFTFTPSVSFQKNINDNASTSNTYWNGVRVINSITNSNSTTTAANLSASLLYRHKFGKPGRTLSTEVDVSKNTNNADGTSIINGSVRSATSTPNRSTDNNSGGYSYGGSLIYTEPLSTNAMLQASYRVSYNHRDIDKEISDILTAKLDTGLSNKYNSDYLTQRAGLGYRYRNSSGLMLMANLDFQHASLNGDQTFPKIGTTDVSFNSFLPMVMLNYKIDNYNSLRFSLRSNTSAPSIQQLQNVVDNSNPLSVTGGNPALKQQMNSNAMLRYTFTPKSGQTLIVMLSAGNTLHYIGDSIFYNSTNKTVIMPNGVPVIQGAQYSTPVNMSGNWNLNSLITYGFPIDFLKSNLNISGSFGLNRLPSLYNGVRYMTNNYTITPKMILSSNISDKIDFTLSYGSSWNIANTADAGSVTGAGFKNTNYLNQSAMFKLDWIMWKGFTFQNVFNYQNNLGLSQGYNENYFLWNLSVGKKIFKNQRGEIKLQAYDVLHQNKSLTHNVSAEYYEDDRTNVLKPYYMLTFTYDLRNFKGQQQYQKQQDDRRRRWQNFDRDGIPAPPRDGGGRPDGGNPGTPPPPPMM
jgi:hypothetical protein